MMIMIVVVENCYKEEYVELKLSKCDLLRLL